MRFALLLLGLAACDPASEAACADAAAIPGKLVIGTGEDTFETVADGDAVHVNYGPQGGQHVWGSLRAAGIVTAFLDFSGENDPVVDFQVLHEGELIVGYEGYSRGFSRDGETAELVGEQLILDSYGGDTGFQGFEGWDGMEVTLVAHLVDACGRELSAERTITLAD